MAFMLLGRYPDGRLVLLSERTHETQKEALAELAVLTKGSGFADWDAEVVVLDVEQGTPVLLVRPESAEAPEAEADVEEAAAEALDGAELEVHEVKEAVAEDEPEAPEEPDTEEESAVEEPSAEEAAEAEPETAEESDPALAAVIQDLETEEATETEVELAPVDEAFAAAVVADAADDSAVEQPTAESPGEDAPSLRDALERTARKMESEGIVAPESVGPAPVGEPVAAEDVAEEPAGPTPGETGSWPWVTADSGLDLDGIESPGVDEGSLVRAPGDDETMAAARPVILGAYDEVPEEQSPEPSAGQQPAPEPVDAPTPEPESDFILDLDEIAEAGTDATPAPVDTAGVAPSDDLTSMTCDDCVYTETCPNKGDRTPATCGSFQWK